MKTPEHTTLIIQKDDTDQTEYEHSERDWGHCRTRTIDLNVLGGARFALLTRVGEEEKATSYFDVPDSYQEINITQIGRPGGKHWLEITLTRGDREIHISLPRGIDRKTFLKALLDDGLDMELSDEEDDDDDAD